MLLFPRIFEESPRASAEDSANGCRADSNQLPNYSMNLRNPNHFNEHLNVKPKPNRNRQLPQSELAPPLSGSSPSKPCKESRKNPKNTIEKKNPGQRVRSFYLIGANSNNSVANHSTILKIDHAHALGSEYRFFWKNLTLVPRNE